MAPTTQKQREKRRHEEEAESRRVDRELRVSIAFYFGIMFLAGQFLANVLLRIPYNYLLLGITGMIVLGILFGPKFAIDFFRAIRGGSSRDDGGSGPDA